MIVRFGPFELDRAAGELRKDGGRLRLQDKPLRVLDALVRIKLTYPGVDVPFLLPAGLVGATPGGEGGAA